MVASTAAARLRLRPYWVAAQKGYSRNLQYRASHLINNVASAIFGFVFIAIWQAAGSGSGVGPYTAAVMTHYVAFGQAALWITMFLPYGLGIPEAVRTGTVSLELMRPVSFFGQVLAREGGHVLYNACFRSLPLTLIFALTTGFPSPAGWTGLAFGLTSLALGGYVALCLIFMVGLSAFWTIEVRWAHYVWLALSMALCGNWLPVDLLPGALGQVAPYLPFAALVYHPARAYMGLAGWEAVVIPAGWAVLLTGGALAACRLARRRVEVQGG